MRGLHRASYATALGALLVAGALTSGGIALADSYGSDSASSDSAASDDGSSYTDDDGTNTRGADGKDGTATTECKTKFSTDVYAPMQCYPSVSKGSDSDDEHGKRHKRDRDSDSDTSTPGASGANGSATDNGAPSPGDLPGTPKSGGDQYKNPVTQEHHFIPLPNIGYNPLNPPSA